MPVPRKSKSGVDSGFDAHAFLAKKGPGRALVDYAPGQVVFAQGDRADSLFYINKGKIAVSVVSRRGKEAIIAILGPGTFFGEGCLAGQTLRMSTAKAMVDSSVTRLQKSTTVRDLEDKPALTALFLQHLLTRS